MGLPKQTRGVSRTTYSTPGREMPEFAGIEPQQCQTGPCVNGKQYRVCVTRKNPICEEVPGKPEWGIPTRVVCRPGDYNVNVTEIDCNGFPGNLSNFPTQFGLLGG